MLYVETVNTGKPGQVAYDRLAGNVPANYADIVIRPDQREAVEKLIAEMDKSDILPGDRWVYVEGALGGDIWDLGRLQECCCGVWESEEAYALEMMYGSYDDVLYRYIDWYRLGQDLTADYTCIYLPNGWMMLFNPNN